MSVLDSNVVEGMPDERLYQSFNGKVIYGGLEVMRVQRATVTISRNADVFNEIGKRSGVVYITNTTVRVSLRRAMVNGAEMRLAIGRTGGVKTFSSDTAGIVPTDFNTVTHTQLRSSNSYPYRFDAEFEIDSVDGIKTTSGLKIKVYGLMIDTTSIDLSSGGDVVMYDQLNLVGEYAEAVVSPAL